MSKKIFKQVGKAIFDFNMIKNNDNIAVCLSGGKDSLALLNILHKLLTKAPVNFKLFAIKINTKNSKNNDEELLKYCSDINVKLHIINTNIDKIIKEKNNKKKSYCAFCARLRRGFIYTKAEELKATKIALGHHREDFNETFIMNLLFSGQLKSMAPILRTDNKKHIVIRPLVYVSENAIIDYVKKEKLPISKYNCFFENKTKRIEIKNLINNLEKDYPLIKETILKSLKNIKTSHLLDQNFIDFKDI